MDCTKCEYYEEIKSFDPTDFNITHVNKKCISCNVLFPWHNESQYKEKE